MFRRYDLSLKEEEEDNWDAELTSQVEKKGRRLQELQESSVGN